MLMRLLVVVLAAVLMTACATQANIGAGGQVSGRAADGGVRLGVPF